MTILKEDLQSGYYKSVMEKYLPSTGRAFTIPIPEEFIVPSQDPKDLIEWCYKDLTSNLDNPDYFAERVILSPKYEHIDALNLDIAEKIDGDFKHYYSSDTTVDAVSFKFQTEFLNTLQISGKILTPLIYIHNLTISNTTHTSP